jgi:hypothetical protein
MTPRRDWRFRGCASKGSGRKKSGNASYLQSHQFFVQAMNAHFYHGTFSYFHHLFFQLAACFFYHFFNTGRVDTAIGNQSL